MSGSTSDLAFESARGLAERLRKREVSSVELLDHYLQRIERHNPSLNAVITLDAEGARRAAALADAALARGELWGPLHGVPITIKDAFEVAGMLTTCGAKIWKDHVPKRDAIAVQRLRAAGAVIMGKTNVPAFCAEVQTFNTLVGTTNNPWDLRRTPGGSSGGAAAALAAGLTPLELGSDIGGSIRTPANWSGIFGHKTSYGLIPQHGHLPGAPGTWAESDLSVIGPMARCTDDLQLMLDVLAGPRPEQAVAYSLRLPCARSTTLRGYRVAAWFDDPAFPIDDGVRGCLEASVAALRRAGVVVHMQKPDFELRQLYDVYRQLLDVITSAGLPARAVSALRAEAANPSGDQSLTGYARNALRSHHEWLALHEQREGFRRAFHAFFEHTDVLLCPVSSLPAIVHDQTGAMVQRTIHVNGQLRPFMDLLGWIAPATACYLPATVIPVGQTAGLPVGVQIVGPYLEDRTTLDFAGRLSELTGGFVRPPGY